MRELDPELSHPTRPSADDSFPLPTVAPPAAELVLRPLTPPVAPVAPAAAPARSGSSVDAVRQAGRAAVGGALRAARTTAYRGTRPVVNLFAGIGCFFRGAGRFLTSPALWPYAVAPVVLVVLAMLGIAAAVEAAAEVVIGWVISFAESWPQWIYDLLSGLLIWAVRLAVHAALGYAVLPLSIVLGAPCYVLLARRIERRLGPVGGAGAGGTTPPLWRACAIAIRQAVLITVVLQFGWLLLAPLMLIPGLNLFLAFGAVLLLNGFVVGLLVLAIPMHHHGTSTVRGQLRTVWRHRASVLGFGATSVLLLGIPLTPVRVVVAPLVFTGAVLLHRRMRRIDEERRAAGAASGVKPVPAPDPTIRALPPAGPPEPYARPVADPAGPERW